MRKLLNPVYLFAVVFLLYQFCCENYVSCENLEELDWWQTTIIYQVYPRSFKDSDNDGLGDIAGIESKAGYFKELGVGAVWLNPIFESPMIDLGYDITNYTKVDETFGTMDDLRRLKKALQDYGIKLIFDFVPNHTSDKSKWFQNSIKRIDPYTDFYVWKDPRGWDPSGNPLPPNNWISVFSVNSAWTWNAERQQFYLHQFLGSQPDLNFRCPELCKAIEDVIKFWLDAGIDGLRIDAAPFLVEDEKFPDEVYIHPDGDHYNYYNIIHNYTRDQPFNFDVLRSWRTLVDNYTKKNNVSTRIILSEVYATVNKSMKYYGTSDEPISHIPFNFQLILKGNPQANAKDLGDGITEWLDHIPKGFWPNWVIGNHDQPRVTTRYGTEMADAFNMLVTLLPGTAVTYYGEELGMEDTFVRWDQTVDPAGLLQGKDKYLTASRDLFRTPMQWNYSMNSGFTDSIKSWLPVNPDFWRLNVKAQQDAENSHLKVYKRLVEARKLPTIQRGDVKIYTPTNWTLIFTRSLENYTTFVVVINMATEQAEPDLTTLGLPEKLHVYAASINSENKVGDIIDTNLRSFKMRQKSSLVLTTDNITSASFRITASSFITSLLALSVYICRYIFS